MDCYVYRLYLKDTGHICYVGKTKNLINRIKVHYSVDSYMATISHIDFAKVESNELALAHERYLQNYYQEKGVKLYGRNIKLRRTEQPEKELTFNEKIKMEELDIDLEKYRYYIKEE